MFDEVSDKKLYQQVADILRQRTLMGDLKEKLPSESMMCAEFGVSRITIRKAVDELKRQGLVVTKQGMGSFVCSKQLEPHLPKFYSFTEEFKKRGWTPSSVVIRFEANMRVPTEIMLALHLDNGELGYYFERVRYADETPMAVDLTWIPKKRFPDLTREALEKRSLYEIMRTDFGVLPIAADQYIGAIILREEGKKYFGLTDEEAAIDMIRITTDGLEPIEYTRSLARASMFRFSIRLS